MENMPNMRVITGGVATLCGLILLIFSWSIFFRVILFCSGAFLLHRGVRMLDSKACEAVADTVKHYLNKFFGE